MKKRIEHLLAGRFNYEMPALMFSKEKLTLTLSPGEAHREEIYLGAEDNRKIRGYITSSDERVEVSERAFSGNTVGVSVTVRTTGLSGGEVRKGWLCFTTSVGEYRLPFEIRIRSVKEEDQFESFAGLQDFGAYCEKDFRGAYRLFTGKGFREFIKNEKEEIRSLYEGFIGQPVGYQNLEEFLISAGVKEKVGISLPDQSAEFFSVREATGETFRIRRNGWGYLRLEVEITGDFLETEKRVITDEDFIGSGYDLSYIVRADRLGDAKQTGAIRIRSPYEELVFAVTASRSARIHVNLRAEERRCKLEMLKDAVEYACGKTDFSTWTASTHYTLNRLKESGFDYPEYQMYEACILHLEGKDREAHEILKTFRNKQFRKEDLELAGAYLGLCTATGLYKDVDNAVKRIRGFYAQKEDSFVLLCVLGELDPALRNSASSTLFEMEAVFDRGCMSPLLYAQAWKLISEDVRLFHGISDFMIQVFSFAARRGLLTEELVMRFSYLTGYEKLFRNSVFRILEKGYESCPSTDLLESICRYIMLGNPRNRKYFPWYREAVRAGLRLTRLYEYYVETMDLNADQALPRPLLMYFAYNTNTLGDTRRACLYAEVVREKEHLKDIYGQYREAMRAFAGEKLLEGRINEDYAILYREFMEEFTDERECAAMAGLLFTNRVYCGDPGIRSIVVRDYRMEKEEIFPSINGVAYPAVISEDSAILFRDERQRRFASTVYYNRKPLFDLREVPEHIKKAGMKDAHMLLYYSGISALSRDNVQVWQQMVGNEAFTEEFRNRIKRKVLRFYRERGESRELDRYLLHMDYRDYLKADRKTLVDVLIERGFYRQCFDIVKDFGSEGLSCAQLEKLIREILPDHTDAEEPLLLAMASRLFREGGRDPEVLRFMMPKRYGPMDELLALQKAAGEAFLDTRDLDERILGLLMLTWDFRKEGERILKDYVSREGREPVTGAYLTLISYGSFVKEYPMSSEMRSLLMDIYRKKWPVNRICHLALFKEIVRERDPKGRYLALKEELLRECVDRNLIFSFYRKLPKQMLSPYQLDDKVFVECHACPDSRVFLEYSMDSGLGKEPEEKVIPMEEMYEGIYVRTFTMFYGESLRYRFRIREKDVQRKTSERVINMNRSDSQAASRYQLINQILSARKLGKNAEAAEKLKKYLRQEQFVREMFPIVKGDA